MHARKVHARKMPAYRVHARKMHARKVYQIRKANKEEGLPLLLGAVGLITDAVQTRDIVEESLHKEAEAAKSMVEQRPEKEPMADAISVARQFMREPEWVLMVAWKLGVDVAWPSQFRRVKFIE